MPETAALQLRHFKLKGLEIGAEAEGTFRGYCSIFGVTDSYNTKFERGAFRKTISDSDTRPLLAGHDPHQIIGIVKLAEDQRGLVAEGQLNLDVARAREIRSLMLQKAISGMSIGFIPRRWRDLEDGTTVFDEVELIEVSLTPFPAQKFARVEDVRSLKKEDSMEINKKFEELETQLERVNAELAETRQQINAVDLRTQRGSGAWSTTSMDFAKEAVQKLAEFRGSFDANARVRFETSNPLLVRVSRPAVLPSAGSATIGQADFAPLSELLAAIPSVAVDAPSVVAVREATTSTWGASPQAEGAVKYEASPQFESETLPVRTIAVWLSATRQILDDVPGCEAFLRSRLEQALMREVEQQVLLGSGAGETLKGLMTQATVWTPPTFAFDLIGGLMHATMIVRQRGFNPNIIVVSPQDELRLRLLRDLNGQYITAPAGLPRVIPCASMTAGQFLIADVSQVVLRTKQALTVDISEHHSDFFVRNQIAIRAELRAALVCYSPRSLLKGTLQTSPAS